jgi:ubiquinone/menaquinone biosynthesis C-methylase UbiE
MTQPAIDPRALKDFERKGYSRVARSYDSATATVTAQVNDAILDAVATRPGTRLLDVACGPGWLSAAAVERGATVAALDFADTMLPIARVRCPAARVYHRPVRRGRLQLRCPSLP